PKPVQCPCISPLICGLDREPDDLLRVAVGVVDGAVRQYADIEQALAIVPDPLVDRTFHVNLQEQPRSSTNSWATWVTASLLFLVLMGDLPPRRPWPCRPSSPCLAGQSVPSS